MYSHHILYSGNHTLISKSFFFCLCDIIDYHLEAFRELMCIHGKHKNCTNIFVILKVQIQNMFKFLEILILRRS